METNQHESVTQSEKSGASSEVVTEKLTKPERDFKADMLKYKDEVSKLQDQLNEINLTQEQKKGNLEGVINSLKDELKKTKATVAQDRYKWANTQLDNAIKTEALNRGINGKALDMLMRVVDKDDKAVVSLDENFNANNEDVKMLLDKQMERYGEFFKKNVKIVDGVPSNKPPAKTLPKNPNEMTTAELKDHILKNYK